jgi:hypothetical protein
MAISRPDEEHPLYVPLTDEQLLMKGQHLAGYELQKANIEAEAKAKAADYKAKVEVLSAAIKLTSGEIDRKEQQQLVLCTWRLEGKKWRLWRTDELDEFGNPLRGAKPLTEQVATQAELHAAAQGEMFS